MCPIDTPCLSASEVVSDAGQNGRFWRLRTLKLWFFIIREKRKPFPPFLLLFPLWGIYSERNTIRSLSPSSFAFSLRRRRLIFLISQMTGAQSPGSLPLPCAFLPRLASEEEGAGNAITIALLSSPSSRSLTAAAADCTNRKPHPQCWIPQVFRGNRIFNKRWTFLSKLYVHLSN